MTIGKLSTPPLSNEHDISTAIRDVLTRLNQIVDAVNKLTGAKISFTDLLTHPDTLAGYGIIDAAPKIHKHVVADITDFPTSSGGGGGGTPHIAFTDLTSHPVTLDGYGITDASRAGHTHTFGSLLSKPNTLAGYGITDGGAPANYDTLYYRKADVDNRLATKVDMLDGWMDGLFVQRQILDHDRVIPAGDIGTWYGPIDLQATLDVQGTLVIL